MLTNDDLDDMEKTRKKRKPNTRSNRMQTRMNIMQSFGRIVMKTDKDRDKDED